MTPSRNLVGRSGRRPLTVWLPIILLLLTSNAYGQTFTLTPSLAVGERYDDNIFQDRRDEESDFVTLVTPGVHLQYVPSLDTELDFEYRPTFEFFASNSDENGVTHRLSLTFASPLTRIFSLRISDELRMTNEPGDRLLEIDEVTGLRSESRDRRERTIRNRARGALDIRLASKSTLGLLFDSLIEDVNVPDELDEFRYTAGAELGYLITASGRTQVGVLSDVTFHTFSPNSDAVPEREDFRVYTVHGAFRHDFSRTLSGRATLGYAVIDSDNPEADGESSIVASLDVIKTLRTGKALFGYRRQFRSGGGTGRVVLADRFIASTTFRIAPKITVEVETNVSFFDFKQISTDTESDDRLFWTIRPRVVYEVLRFWSLSVSYDYEFTDYDAVSEPDRAEHRLIFTSRFALREHLFVDLTYRYTSRRFDGGREEDEFDRNQVTLTITYAPDFFL